MKKTEKNVFQKELDRIVARIPEIREKLRTDDDIKNTMIMPLLDCLGYNVFDPDEVMFGYNSSDGRYDCVVMKDGETFMVIEFKKNLKDVSPPPSFAESGAKIGVVTNGTEYKIYSMDGLKDGIPACEIDLEKLKKEDVKNLESLGKDSPGTEIAVPDEHKEKLAKRLVKKYGPAVRIAVTEIAIQRLNERLDTLKKDENRKKEESVEEQELLDSARDEITGLMIVRAIAARICDVERLDICDESDCALIVLDKDQDKIVAKMEFHGKDKMYFSVVDGDAEIRWKLKNVNDIYGHQDEILKMLSKAIK